MSLTEVAGNKYSDHHRGYKYISQLHLPLTIMQLHAVPQISM